MTRKTIREIMDVYLRNDVPEPVKGSFETWMTDQEDWQEKHEALEDIWNCIPETDLSCLPAAEDVLDAALGKEKMRPGRDRHRLLWLTSAAAVVFAVISVVQFATGNVTETCLASSDSAKGHFTLPDGSSVWLNRGSRLYYSGNLDGRTRKVRLEGEGFFDVSKNESHPFVVEAYDMDITVLGTEFTVTAYGPEKVSAYLQEGSIMAHGPGLSKGVLLKPDQSITYDKAASTYSRSQIKSSNHTSWIGDKLVFSGTSLCDICETLCHWYNADISCSDAAFASGTRLSFTVRQEPLSEILDAIGHLAKVTCNSDENGHITITPSIN